MSIQQVKFFFLVAGFEYSNKGLDFDHMCTGRVWERCTLLNNTLRDKSPLVSADTTLRFLRFNFSTGKIQMIEKSFVVGKGIKNPLATESDWKAIPTSGTDPYDPGKFVVKTAFRAISKTGDYINQTEEYPDLDQSVDKLDLMSITDVYKSVRDAPGGSVLELSFFSHGWIDGPVLVNSSNHTGSATLRDPRDKDGRATLDFKLNMGMTDTLPDSLTQFVQFLGSFDPKGIVQSWGCNFDIDLPVVAQTNQAIAKAKAAKKAFTDDSVIEFEFEKWQPDRYRVADPAGTFFPADKSTTTMTRKFKEVKKFLRKRLASSYVFQFVAATLGNGTALGALPGTEGDDEKRGFKMMKVCAKVDEPECPNGFASIFKFFNTHLGVSVSDRGYAVFDPATMTKLQADITADGP